MIHARKNVLSIFGSPRREGYSSRIHRHLLEIMEGRGIAVGEIHVHDLNIIPCTACGHCRERFACIHEDDMAPVYSLVRDASMVVVSSPVYFSGLNGQLKIFIDRCQVLWELGRRPGEGIAGKEALFIAAAGSDYPGVFTASQITIRHLYNTLGARFSEDDYILLAGTDLLEEVPRGILEKTASTAAKYADMLTGP